MSRKLTVLVADDDASMRSMLALMLDNLFELDVVGTAAEAEGLMRSKNYDLLVLDVHLPDDTGLNLYKKLYKNRESDGPALMVISADDKNDMISKAYDLGALCYICKPFNVDAFQLLLQRYCSEQKNRRDTSLHEPFNVTQSDALQCANDILIQVCNAASPDSFCKTITSACSNIGIHTQVYIETHEIGFSFDALHGPCLDIEKQFVRALADRGPAFEFGDRLLASHEDLSILVKRLPDDGSDSRKQIVSMITTLVPALSKILNGISGQQAVRKALASLQQVAAALETSSNVSDEKLAAESVNTLLSELKLIVDRNLRVLEGVNRSASS